MEPKRDSGHARPPHRLIAAYRPIAGIHDEMLDESGRPRPLWATLVAALEDMSPHERNERFGRAEQYLRDTGVYYRVYGEGGARERDWPLAHIPLLIAEDEWTALSSGLVERAELLEHVVADVYGDNRLVADGLLPPELVAGNPEFLRPLVGVRPRDGHYLHFLAFELGRGHDGRWMVLGDRTQAPSGAGFALENRVATTRALTDIVAEMNVHRLAGFFRRFRETLLRLADDADGRAAILTPGPLNETYYEHAWIARYLGIALLEGQDLRVRDGQVMVRTVSGLMPVGVLWRRLDAAFMDPLELKGDSWIGTAGLVEALRAGAISVVNALGSGILETRALQAFLPGIARAVNGRDLGLPSVATWWCGSPADREHVLANLADMVVGPALTTRLPFEDVEETRVVGALDARESAALARRLGTHGHDFAAQANATLSTTPVYAHGKLEPRPVALRVFAIRTASGWSIMPGGLARVGRSLDPSAITMQRGGQAADVWVVSPRPVAQDTMLPGEIDPPQRYQSGNLPSRAAENLFWLGRYAERLEGSVRILRAYHVRLAEAVDPNGPLLSSVRAYLDFLGVDAHSALPEGVLRTVRNATGSAGQIRDRFSPDGWLALDDLSKTLHRFAERVQPGDDAARALTIVLRKQAGFSGLVHENMYRFTGWRFLEIGRRIERGIHMARIIQTLASRDAPDGALEMLLEVGDSVLTHRRQFSVNASRRGVVEVLALDPLNPRSLLFQLDRLKDEIGLLPDGGHGHLSAASKEVLHLHTQLSIADARTIDDGAFAALVAGLGTLSDVLTRSYFT